MPKRQPQRRPPKPSLKRTVSIRTPLSHWTSLTQTGMTLYPVTSSDDANRLMESRLMHHYTTTVCHELPPCNGNHTVWMWQTRVPLVAFQSGIVLDSLLTLAALHLQCLTPDDPSLADAVTKYLDRSVFKHRMALPMINGDSAEPLLVAAIVISASTWLLSHRRMPNEPYKLPMLAWSMMRGVKALFHAEKSLFEIAGYGWYGFNVLSLYQKNAPTAH